MTRQLHKSVKEVIKDAESLGWEFIGFNGRGHPHLRHPATGASYSIPSTPGEWRGRKNSIADLERLSGRKLPRQKRGRSRGRGRISPLNLRQSANEAKSCAAVDGLLREAEELRTQMAGLAADGSRAAAESARRVIVRYEQIREAAEQLHRHLPPIT